MTDKRGASANEFLFLAIVFALAAGLLGLGAGAVVDPVAGIIVAAVLGVPATWAFLVGTIAKGVEVGNRAS